MLYRHLNSGYQLVHQQTTKGNPLACAMLKNLNWRFHLLLASSGKKGDWEKNYPLSESQQKPSEVVSLKGAITNFNLFKYTSVFLLNFSYSETYVLIIH